MMPLERRIKQNGKVDLWDTGPGRPTPPVAPSEPDPAKLRGVALAEAEIEYEDACERHKKNLRKFMADKQDHLDWHEKNGGPIKVELWGIDARHAMEVEPERFKLDLGRGQKPGRAQIEADEMAQAEAEAMSRASASDPQFGKQRAVA